MRTRRALAAVAVGLSLLVSPQPAAAGEQGQTSTGAAQSSQTAQADLDRIRAAVNRDPAFKFDESQVRFYLQVLAPAPTFSDFVKGQDLTSGVVADAPMTHREFLDMVTPKELYSAAGIRPTETLQGCCGLAGCRWPSPGSSVRSCSNAPSSRPPTRGAPVRSASSTPVSTPNWLRYASAASSVFTRAKPASRRSRSRVESQSTRHRLLWPGTRA